MKFIAVNEKCTGDNINRGVGVAEIEGTEFYSGKEYDKHIPTVKKIFDEGRKSPANSVYGIAVDGDAEFGHRYRISAIRITYFGIFRKPSHQHALI